MSIPTLKEHINDYLSGNISREELDQKLDTLHHQVILRLKDDLYFEDLFLSALLPHLTTLPEQAYSDEELRLLLKALEDGQPFCLPRFITLSPRHLNDHDLKVLCLAEDYLKKGELPESPLFENKRYEFEMPKTLPSLMAKDLLYLLWMAKKPEWVLSKTGLDRRELKEKIQSLVLLLSGMRTAYLRVGVDCAAVL